MLKNHDSHRQRIQQNHGYRITTIEICSLSGRNVVRQLNLVPKQSLSIFNLFYFTLYLFNSALHINKGVEDRIQGSTGRSLNLAVVFNMQYNSKYQKQQNQASCRTSCCALLAVKPLIYSTRNLVLEVLDILFRSLLTSKEVRSTERTMDHIFSGSWFPVVTILVGFPTDSLASACSAQNGTIHALLTVNKTFGKQSYGMFNVGPGQYMVAPRD